MTRVCIVAGCEALMTTGGRMCEAHWYRLPGRLRSQLYFTDFRSQVGRELWARARDLLERDAGDTMKTDSGGGRMSPPLSDPDAPADPPAGVSAPQGRPVETVRSRPSPENASS